MKREFDNTSEIWRDISNTGGQYQISNFGKVRRVLKSGYKELKGYPTHGGYLTFNLKGKRRKAHKMVADAFILNINEYPQVDHINRNKVDNRKSNLRYVTESKNSRNKINNHVLTIGNKTKCIAEWSDISGVNRKTIFKRLEMGWDSERAVFTPTAQLKKNR